MAVLNQPLDGAGAVAQPVTMCLLMPTKDHPSRPFSCISSSPSSVPLAVSPPSSYWARLELSWDSLPAAFYSPLHPTAVTTSAQLQSQIAVSR